MEGKYLLRQDILYNSSDNLGLSYIDYEILNYVFQKTECLVSNIWDDLELQAKKINLNLERLEKNKLILRIKGSLGEMVHLTEKGSLLTLLLDTYSIYAPKAERGESIVSELLSFLHMIKVPLEEERLQISEQLKNISEHLSNKSKEIKGKR